MSLFLHEITQEAINFIRQNEPSNGYFLGFSGGKDSVVLYDLMKKSGVKYKAFYNNTTIDPPEVVQFIKTHYQEVVFINPKISFWQGLKKYGCPTFKRRWCCKELKEQANNELSKQYKHRIFGIRAEESISRGKRQRIDVVKNKIIYKPVFWWSSADIWDYISYHNLKVCELYNEGFSRLGCIVCPLRGKHEQKRYIERYPKYFKLYNFFAMQYYEKHKDKIDKTVFESYLF